VPSIRDRIVQEALRMLLEPIFEADFSPRSYGFRPGRCTMDAASYVAATATGQQRYYWIIEGDIASYFDTMNHRKLLKLVAKRIRDKKVLTLIWQFLKAGVMEGKLFRDTRAGTPQGEICSPLFANIYLYSFDRCLTRYTAHSESQKLRRRRHGHANFLYARYADDFVVLCNGTKRQAEAMREEVQHFLSTELKLTLSMEKTKITHLNDGYEFLGFQLSRGIGQSGKPTPRIRIPRRAIRTFKEKILRMTRRTQDSNRVENPGA
jgi:RNA-directed DNA polymerase